MTATQSRTPTPVDNLIDAYLDEYVALDPIFATAIGVSGHEAELPDLSPEWLEAVSAPPAAHDKRAHRYRSRRRN